MLGKIRRILLPVSFTMMACGLICSLSGWWMTPTLIVLGAALALCYPLIRGGVKIIRTRPPQFKTSAFLKINEEERRQSSFHEAAHCVVAWFNPAALEPIQVRVASETVGEEIPAYTAYRPNNVNTESQMRASIAVAFAGAAADLIISGEKTTGCGHDLIEATTTARLMTCRYGMGSGLPPRSFNLDVRDFDDATAGLINRSIGEILESGRDEAGRTVKEHWPDIAKVASAVLENETLEAEDIIALLGPRPK